MAEPKCERKLSRPHEHNTEDDNATARSDTQCIELELKLKFPMKKHTKCNTKLTDEKIATYKAVAQRISIDDQLKSLDTCSRHHNTLAASAADGLRKANYLEACLDA